MMKMTNLKIDNNDVLGSIKTLLGTMMESKFIEAVLVPKMLPSGDGFVQSLLSSKKNLENINPFAPTMPVQTAKILSELSKGPLAGKIGVVVKPCELKAAVELVKFLQVNLDNIVTIGVDCAGTYEVDVYKEMVQNKKTIPFDSFLKSAGKGEIKSADGYMMRDCCSICTDPVPVKPDISIGFYGSDPSKNLFLMIGDRFEKEFAEKLSLSPEDAKSEERDDVVQKIKKTKSDARSKMLAELKKDSDSIEKMINILSTCIRCHNCMNVCPICYCKECVFESSIFEHKPAQFLNLARRNGAVRMPGDTLIFHLTRMSHMATSCVNCGMCEIVCPSGIQVARLFAPMGSELQVLFEYVPGKDIKEVPPVFIFKEEELENIHQE